LGGETVGWGKIMVIFWNIMENRINNKDIKIYT
jgi:hypothetical protein